MPKYPHLMQPLQLNNMQLSNRVIMGSMHLGLEEARNGFEKMAAFYAERARGGVALIITGGISPNEEGRPYPGGAKLTQQAEVEQHQLLTQAVHKEGGLIAMQILHFGRYAYHPALVAPSPLQAPISPFKPREMKHADILKTIEDFVTCAELAQRAGYDGVEIMGSEGYLINEFIAQQTNHREDEWGGDYANRIRFALEIVRQTRARLGPDFIIVYRLSMLDLVEKGSTFTEVVHLAQQIEAAGASLLNTGIGWHEARIPTIATCVPRAAFSWISKQVKEAVSIPVAATNRINTPEVAEDLLKEGLADLVCMARPFLADPEFVRKAFADRADEINTCIACNQACLDHVFVGKSTSCLVNPRACRETELQIAPTQRVLKLAVVGAGPGGLACATTAAERGHQVTLYEAQAQIGGQFNLAKCIPGKEEFAETLRYFAQRLKQTGVKVRLSQRVEAHQLEGQFDAVVLATGVTPRMPHIPGVAHDKVITYVDVLKKLKPVGQRVALIGAGGIGFDVAEYLSQANTVTEQDARDDFYKEWGIDPAFKHPGGIQAPQRIKSDRQIWLLQRKSEPLGKKLGKTTGWIHRATLKKRGVAMISGVEYRKIDAQGLHLRVNGDEQLLDVDTVVLCAGQESCRDLLQPLQNTKMPVYLIGGADVASELDAKRAIKQGVELAIKIENTIE